MDVFREVLRQIEQYIDRNRLQPGDRLPSDRELAATLNVSRPLVRQAIKALESLGRVTAHQGSGTFVQNASHRVAVAELMRGLSFDRTLLGHILPARIAIELEVMRSAFARRTPARMTLLRGALEQSTDNLQEAALDLTFEATLGRVCGNEVLRRLQALVHDIWLGAEIAAGVVPAGPARLHDEHRQIFEAFAAGDLDEALRRFGVHLGAFSDADG